MVSGSTPWPTRQRPDAIARCGPPPPAWRRRPAWPGRESPDRHCHAPERWAGHRRGPAAAPAEGQKARQWPRAARHGAGRHMQRQHGALAEAHQNQAIRRQATGAPILRPENAPAAGADRVHALSAFHSGRCGKWETIDSRESRAAGQAHWVPQTAADGIRLPANAAPGRSGHCRPSHSHAPAPPDGVAAPLERRKAGAGQGTQSHAFENQLDWRHECDTFCAFANRLSASGPCLCRDGGPRRMAAIFCCGSRIWIRAGRGKNSSRAIFEDLHWLGLTWPEPVLRQSAAHGGVQGRAGCAHGGGAGLSLFVHPQGNRR